MTDLRKLAEAATPGPWRTSWDDESYPPDGDPDQWLIRAGDENVVWMFFYDGEKLGCSAADARYIAACSPEAILALLDRAERAERERDEARSRLIESEHLRHVAEECCVEARAERDARPEITVEDAARWLDDHPRLPDPDEVAIRAWERIDFALRAHAAKVTR